MHTGENSAAWFLHTITAASALMAGFVVLLVIAGYLGGFVSGLIMFVHKRRPGRHRRTGAV